MMNWKFSFFVIATCFWLGVVGQFEWQSQDAFDEIRNRLNLVTEKNCEIQHNSQLFLPENSVSHIPNIQDINVNPTYPNRTALLHLHNMALSRSFFWSYIFQSRFIRPAINETYDPGMMYHFLSTIADVSSNSHINASAIYFAPNMSYSSSYRGFFNKTLLRFAPRTIRVDDFNDPVHLEKASTRNTFYVKDLGASPSEFPSQDYTTISYRINEWYRKWLPDNHHNRHDTKKTYKVEIRYANNTNESFSFHGPPSADETQSPVKWTRPYFDCHRSNRWLISAVVPIADIFPRHTNFRHIEYPTYTAISVVEMDFERIDINQCPISAGNMESNQFNNTAKCKEETTECEPIDGWGFRRGGYQCKCRPGYRLPRVVRRPYLGEIIERASRETYQSGFECDKIGWIHKMPVQWERYSHYIREKYLEEYPEYKPFSNYTERININRSLTFIHGVTPNNCHTYTNDQLHLSGDYSYNSEKFFENEAKMATRLANFISAFLQVVDETEVYTGMRVPDRPLTEDQMIAEALALVAGDTKIWAAGIFWAHNKFTGRKLFAPYAYKTQLNTQNFNVDDLARFEKLDYTNLPWFNNIEQMWKTNYDILETFFLKMHMRCDEAGEKTMKYDDYPDFYRAANLKQGYWTNPYYDCDGKINSWVITYMSPFFGYDSAKVNLEFKGVVTVTMQLLDLDINQCDDKYYVSNAFKNTHKCDKRTSYCVPILGRGYDIGGYKCECKQGFEYPFEDPTTYFDGQIMESEFLKLVENKPSRFDMFKCRLAGAASIKLNLILSIFTLIFLSYRLLDS